MTTRRLLTAAIVALLVVAAIWYEPGMIAGTPEGAPTPGINCEYHHWYERSGLGWDAWDLVEVCE